MLGWRIVAPPEALHWLFWDVELAQLDVERHADYILGRVLERGRSEDVGWAMQTYGLPRLQQFFRERARPDLSARTLAFWRAFFSEDQPWPTSPVWRNPSGEPWHG